MLNYLLIYNFATFSYKNHTFCYNFTQKYYINHKFKVKTSIFRHTLPSPPATPHAPQPPTNLAKLNQADSQGSYKNLA